MDETYAKCEGIVGDKLSDIDIDRYINHTYLKKYKAFGFQYDTSLESQFLLKDESGVENEYCLDEQGDFVPGFLKK